MTTSSDVLKRLPFAAFGTLTNRVGFFQLFAENLTFSIKYKVCLYAYAITKTIVSMPKLNIELLISIDLFA